MRHSTDDNEWESKDGGDHMVKIAAGQRMTKVVFEEGKGLVSYYPDNQGYELDTKNGKVNLYYRDDDLYAENKAGEIASVKVVYDDNEYEMTYNANTQRWEKTDVVLTEGEHHYYYKVKAAKDSEEVIK